jgi:hypothetical protein
MQDRHRKFFSRRMDARQIPGRELADNVRQYRIMEYGQQRNSDQWQYCRCGCGNNLE